MSGGPVPRTVSRSPSTRSAASVRDIRSMGRRITPVRFRWWNAQVLHRVGSSGHSMAESWAIDRHRRCGGVVRLGPEPRPTAAPGRIARRMPTAGCDGRGSPFHPPQPPAPRVLQGLRTRPSRPAPKPTGLPRAAAPLPAERLLAARGSADGCPLSPSTNGPGSVRDTPGRSWVADRRQPPPAPVSHLPFPSPPFRSVFLPAPPTPR